MISVKIEGLDRVSQLANRLNRRVPEVVGDSMLQIGVDTSNEIKRQLISQTKSAPRTKMASRIYPKKVSKNQVNIMMPQQADWLDRMKPHYVSLRRGRNITSWANKYFGSSIKTGKSKVFQSNGMFKGAIYVTPDPFVNKALNRVRARYKNRLQGVLKKASR